MDKSVRYALEPAAFRTMGAAQEITDLLEDNLTSRNLGAANLPPELAELFSAGAPGDRVPTEGDGEADHPGGSEAAPKRPWQSTPQLRPDNG